MKSLPMGIRMRDDARRGDGPRGRRSFRPCSEPMERRQLLSFADGNGPVVTGLIETLGQGGASLVVSFDGPLNPGLAQQVSNYRVNRYPVASPEVVTTNGPADPIARRAIIPPSSSC